MATLTDYIQAAMRRARYEGLEDGTFYGKCLASAVCTAMARRWKGAGRSCRAPWKTGFFSGCAMAR